jgi:hypothetical protein
MSKQVPKRFRGEIKMRQKTRRRVGRSARALDALPERARVVDAAWDRDKGRCQAETLVRDVRCGGRLDPHEVIPRSAWPGGKLVLDNVLIVCRMHHDWIGDHPVAAQSLGLHGFSWERPLMIRCEHESSLPVDDAPADEEKIWRCARCGLRFTMSIDESGHVVKVLAKRG